MFLKLKYWKGSKKKINYSINVFKSLCYWYSYCLRSIICFFFANCQIICFLLSFNYFVHTRCVPTYLWYIVVSVVSPIKVSPVFRCLFNAPIHLLRVCVSCNVYLFVVHCVRVSLSIVCRPHLFFLSSSLWHRCNIVRFLAYRCCWCIVPPSIVSLTLDSMYCSFTVHIIHYIN